MNEEEKTTAFDQFVLEPFLIGNANGIETAVSLTRYPRFKKNFTKLFVFLLKTSENSVKQQSTFYFPPASVAAAILFHLTLLL